MCAGTVYNELAGHRVRPSRSCCGRPPGRRSPARWAELDRRDMSGARRTTSAAARSRPRSGSSAQRSTGRTRSSIGRRLTDRRTWVRRGHGDAARGRPADRARSATRCIAPDVDVGAVSVARTVRPMRLPRAVPGHGRPRGGGATRRRDMLADAYRPRLPEEFDETGLRTSAQRVRSRAHFGGSLAAFSGPSEPAGDGGLADADPSVVRWRRRGQDPDPGRRGGLTRRPR